MSTTLGERVSIIRKKLGMSQQELANELNLSKNYISLVENNKRNLSYTAQTVLCSISGANENWLRTGEGDPFPPRTRREVVQRFVDHLDVLPDDDVKVRLISTLAELDEKYWVILADIAKTLSGQKEEHLERESRLLQEEAEAVKKDGEKCSASPRTKEA